MKTKYRRWHDLIIARARKRILSGYGEKHHILPRCLGGVDDKSNIVKLTYREHFLVHWLLVKIHSGLSKRKMAHAFRHLAHRRGDRIVSSWQYQVARQLYQMSMNGSKQPKISAALKGRRRIFTAEHLANVRAANIKAGFNRRGRPGHIPSTESRAKMAAAKIGTANAAGRRTEEQRARISASQKGRPKPKVSAKLTGRHLSVEHRAAIGRGLLGNTNAQRHVV